MLDDFDVFIVGAGLCGCVAAHELAAAGKRVLITERRDQIGGNLYDCVDEATGIRIQMFGPHAFHTADKELHDYFTQFGTWMPYHLTCSVDMLGKTTPSPFNFQTIDDYFSPTQAAEIKIHLQNAFPGQDQATITALLYSSDPVVNNYARFLFKHDYSLYTAKQWGLRPEDVDPGVLARVPVMFSYRIGYFTDPYQAIPTLGYTPVLEEMITHKNISVRVKTDALTHLCADTDNGVLLFDGFPTKKTVIYTGAVDELLKYQFGPLPYRSLRFQWERHAADSVQSTPIVAYPEAEGYTRITEYSKLPNQATQGKTITAKEYPLPAAENGIEPYYPVVTKDSLALYEQYWQTASRIDNLYLCGRLADFKYYNMDQAIKHTLQLCWSLNR